MALAASSIGYSTRRQVAVHVSVSSRSHAARGSPSRGWPTPPGLMQPARRSDRSSSVPAGAASPDGLPAVVARGTRAPRGSGPRPPRARSISVDALLGLPGGEHVLPDRVARAGVVEREARARRRPGSSALQEGHRPLADVLARPARPPRRRSRRSPRCRCPRSPRGRGSRPGQVAHFSGELHAFVRLGAVADEVAEAPDLLDAVCATSPAPPRRRAGCRARPRAARCASGGLLQCREMRALAAAAGDRRRVAAAAAATFLLRPRSGLIEPAPVDAATATSRPSQLERAHDFRSPQRVLGLAGLGLEIGTLAVLVWRPPRRLCAGSSAAAAARRGGGGGGDLARAGRRRACRSRRWMRSARARRRARHAGVAGLAGRRGEVGGHRGGRWRRGGGLLAMALVRRFPRHWWAPAAVRGGRLGVVTIWLFPSLIDPLFNKFEPLPHGPAPLRGTPAGRPRRRGRGRGLPRRRQPPHHRRQRLRDRPGAQQARRALRQPDRGLPARPGADGRGARARPPEARRPVARPRCGSRSSPRRAPSWPRRWRSALPAAGALGTPAALPAIALAIALASSA